MRPVHFIFAALATVMLSTPLTAFAECNTMLMTGVTSRYVLGDFALVGSNQPGFVSDLALTCPGIFGGTFTVDWWQRVDLSTKGPYGNRSYGDEHDATLTGNWSAGAYDLELSAAYFAVKPLGQLRDDVIQLYADMGRRFDLGFAKAKLAFRPTQYLGISSFPAHTVLRVRAPVVFSLEGLPLANVDLRLEPAASYDFNPVGAQARLSLRPEAALGWQVNDSWRLQLVGKAVYQAIGSLKRFEEQVEIVSVFKLN